MAGARGADELRGGGGPSPYGRLYLGLVMKIMIYRERERERERGGGGEGETNLLLECTPLSVGLRFYAMLRGTTYMTRLPSIYGHNLAHLPFA